MNEADKDMEVMKDIGETSDGYHTFNELYEHRHMLFLALMASHSRSAWFSKKHSDCTEMEGWFVAGMFEGMSQMTYHLPLRLWELAAKTGARELPKAHMWDGHTSATVIDRLKDKIGWFHALSSDEIFNALWNLVGQIEQGMEFHNIIKVSPSTQQALDDAKKLIEAVNGVKL